MKVSIIRDGHRVQLESDLGSPLYEIATRGGLAVDNSVFCPKFRICLALTAMVIKSGPNENNASFATFVQVSCRATSVSI
jgi:hypothetical protein